MAILEIDHVSFTYRSRYQQVDALKPNAYSVQQIRKQME